MATLKISELSVGDWVNHENNAYRLYAIEECGLLRGKWESDEDLAHIAKHIDYFEPIPITAEILEKSGFARSTSEFIVYHTDKVWISYDKPSETWSVTMYINDFTSNLHANILHIHQLQHILRLAGVDKEINL